MEGSIGHGAGRRPTLLRVLAALLGLSAGLLLLRLGSKDVWEASEGRPLESAREMRERGERLVQVTNGEVDLTKPPLYAWAAEASFAIAGRDSEAAGRAPSVLAALGVLAGVAVLGARIAGPRAGFLAGFALLTTAKFLWQARLAELETFLALGVIWAYVAFDAALDATSGARRLALHAASFAATGFGFAVKGPIALLLVLPGALAYALVTRRLRSVLGTPAFWAALPALALVGLPWYAAVVSRDPSALDVLLSFARAENVGHLRDPTYYFLTYPLYALPWTPLVVAGLRMRWTLDLPPESSRRARLPLAAFGVTFVLLSLLPTKQTHYLIPVVFPMGAALAGLWLDRWLAAKAPRAAFGDVLRTAVPFVGLVLLADVLLRPADDASAIVTVGSSLVVALAVLLFLARRMGFAWTTVSRVEAAMVALVALEAFGVGWVVPRFNARQSSREFFEGVAHDVPRGAPLAWTVFGSHSDYLWHLPMSVVTRNGIPELVGRNDAETVARLRGFLAGGGGRYAIVTMAQARALGDEVVVLRREPALQKKGRDVALVRTTGG